MPDDLRSAALPLTVIGPHGAAGGSTWRELWSHRELLYFLVWRDLKVRYKQTVLGAAWAVIQPFSTMVVFTIVFGRLAKMPSDGVPYALFSYAALVPWTYFSSAISSGAASLVSSQNLISKVYFPRLLVPLASVATPLVDAAIALSLIGVLLVWYGVMPGLSLLWLPLFAALAVMTALAISLWLAALNVEFRDVRYVLPFVVQFGLFVTPVAYPTSLVPERWRAVYSLNPMATVVDGFRWSLLGTTPPTLPMILASLVAVTLLLWGGLRHFRRTERFFADIV